MLTSVGRPVDVLNFPGFGNTSSLKCKQEKILIVILVGHLSTNHLRFVGESLTQPDIKTVYCKDENNNI